MDSHGCHLFVSPHLTKTFLPLPYICQGELGRVALWFAVGIGQQGANVGGHPVSPSLLHSSLSPCAFRTKVIETSVTIIVILHHHLWVPYILPTFWSMFFKLNSPQVLQF